MLQSLDKRDYVAALFILIGALLRLHGFADWSLTNDELSAILRTNFSSFSELIEGGIWVDGHPALVQIFEYYWIKIFGKSPFSIRLPFVLMSIGSCIYFYRLIVCWTNKNAAIIGLSLFIPAQLFILHGQIARPYSAGLFFVMAFSFYFFRFLKSSNSKKNAIGIVMFGLAASLTHYFATLGIFLIYGLGVLELKKENMKAYFSFAVITLILYLPHLPITLNHLSIGGVSWLPTTKPDFLFNFLHYFFQNSLVFKTSIALVLLILLFTKSLRINIKTASISLFSFAVIYYVGYYYSVNYSTVLQFSVLIFCAPFLHIFIASFVKKESNFSLVLVTSLILLTTGSYALIFENNFYSKKAFADFEAVAKRSIELENKVGAENVLSFANVNNKGYLRFYTDKIDSTYSFDIDEFENESHVAIARDLIQNSKKDYVLISYANNPVPKVVHEFAKQKYPVIIENYRYFNSDVILYGKGNNERKVNFSTNYLEKQKWDTKQALLQDSIFYSDSLAISILPEIEYALTFRDTLKNLVSEDAKCLTISAQLKSDPVSDFKLVLSVTRGDSTVYWRGENAAPFYTSNRWYQFMYVFQKPDNLLPNDLVTIYFWNPKKESVFIDEFKMYNFADSDFNYYEF